MKSFPPIPPARETPELFEAGHLWLLEQIDGGQLRVQLREAGFLQFADHQRTYQTPNELPPPYQRAVRHIQANLDRDALQQAVPSVESVVLMGYSTHRQTIAYDWERLPPFLGLAVWDGERFLGPDISAQVYERLGLRPVNALEREVRAQDFTPERYEIPDSAWYDGTAAGVIIRNKRGGWAQLTTSAIAEQTTSVSDISPDELAREYATEARVRHVVAELESREVVVTTDRVFERVMDDIHREAGAMLPEDTDHGEIRSAVVARVNECLP